MRSGIDGQGLALLRLEQVEKAKAEGAPAMAGATEILPQAPAGLIPRSHTPAAVHGAARACG